MKKPNTPSRLTASEFTVGDEAGQNRQTAAARWQFIQAIERKVPAFLRSLRDTVYPKYASLADRKRDYWQTGWKLATWRVVSDADNQLMPILLDWARGFNLEGEEWILEGALQTLWGWHRAPQSRDALEFWGFRQHLAEPALIADAEHVFRFEDWGWDPSFISSAGWRDEVTESFQKAVDGHIQKMGELAKERGLLRAVLRFRKEHFEWLALYQCGNLSLDSILARAHHVSNKTTISKGMGHAAALGKIAIRPKHSK